MDMIMVRFFCCRMNEFAKNKHYFFAAHLPDDVRDKIIKELTDPKRGFAARRRSFARNNRYAVCKQSRRRLQRRY